MEEILKELEEKKKRQEKKNQKEKEWLNIREEMNNLVQNINFELPMEEEESMEINSSEQESMEISGDVKDSSMDNSQENTTEHLQDTSPLVNFSMLLLMMYQKYREFNPVEQVTKAPILQPFECGEEKSPLPVSFFIKQYFLYKFKNYSC